MFAERFGMFRIIAASERLEQQDGVMSPRKPEPVLTSETAQLVFRHMRRTENMYFLQRMPGFELKPEMPAQMHNLLNRLHEAERSGQDTRRR